MAKSYPIQKIPDRDGSDVLRLIVQAMDHTTEGFNQRFTIPQLVSIYTAHIASEWDFLPDTWTGRQVQDALRGIVPKWDDNRKPVYPRKKKKTA